ncbi:MAG: DUF3581 family protein [Thiotrichales bacterium]|nr:DUF3581 family protein [Thiotrichales bacterium]
MYLNAFHQSQGHIISITPQQGSAFAKEISDDFNPLHNADSKRFCVPGDLLFALVLARYGLSQKMAFNYMGMVGKDTDLVFPTDSTQTLLIKDVKDKSYLEVTRHGDVIQNESVIESFSKAYVAFSGHSFPHILVPLMEQHQVMINVEKPMVIYESMAFEFDHLNLIAPQLTLSNSQLEVTGKRGLVKMEFTILDQDKVVGKGQKSMILSGLRPYDASQMQTLIAVYQQSKANYLA